MTHAHPHRLQRTQASAALALVLAAAVTPALAGSGGFSNTGSMNVERYDHTATLLADGEVLVAGGLNNSTGYLSSVEIYNPSTGKWRLTGSMTIARDGHSAVLLPNGQVLVAGGLDPNGCCGAPPLNTAELYNPSTGQWTRTGSMTAGRSSFVLMLLPNGEALAAGGADNGTALTSAEIYNPAMGTWTAIASMTQGDESSAAVLLRDNRVFVVGNDNLYNSSTGTWTAAAAAPIFAHAPNALLPNGNVFAAGTIQGDLVYNPSANQWTTFAPPPCTTTKQNCQSAGVLLPTGNVLVAGGVTYVNAQPYPLEETNGLAFLLNPSTLSWTSTGNMSKSRIGETMTLLLSGQALVAGGETFDKHLGRLVPIASAELYTP